MFIKRLLIIISFFTSSIVLSQNETINWYFGDYAGLNFSALNPRVTVLNNGAMSTPAGCSSISDDQGNLLFYTNGQTVWNKNHEIMDKGDNLAADINNSQTSIIIPKPNDPNTYYIFLTRENSATNPLVTSGLFYSEVTFSNQFPLGSLTIKNRRLLNTTTERLTAIHDIATESIKVITFGSENSSGDPRDTFFIYTVDSNGVNNIPVKSKVTPIKSSKGAMKISPDGTKIALANYDGAQIILYNFNIANTSITEDRIVSPNIPFVEVYPYGVEFSADSRILYFTGHISSSSYLYKYHMFSNDPLNERIIIASSSDYFFGDLQLAVDNKIYVANFDPKNPQLSADYLGVIEEPENEFEDSKFVYQSVNLSPNGSFKGLPIFISSYFQNRIIAENTCVGDPTPFETESYMPVDAISWDFGDNATSTDLMPSHAFNSSGNYVVKATIMYNGKPYYLEKNIKVYENPIIDPGETLTQCGTNLNDDSFFNLTDISTKIKNYKKDYTYFFYHTLSDAQDNSNIIQNPEAYQNDGTTEELFARIVTVEGCDTITNFFLETLNGNVIEETPIYTCDESDAIPNNGIGSFDMATKELEIRASQNLPSSTKVIFYPSQKDAQTKTNTLPLFYKSVSTELWFRIENQNNDCAGIGRFEATVNSGLTLNVEESYTLCYSNASSGINLNGGATNEAWEWRDENDNIISTAQNISLANPGKYSVSVLKTENNLVCSRTVKFIIKEPPILVFQELKVENNQVIIAVNGRSTYQYSLDGTTYVGSGKTHIFQQVEPGLYTVYVRDIYNCEAPISKNIAFVGYPRYFTPNNDGINDIWKVKGISYEFYNGAEIFIYDRFGKLLHRMDLISNPMGWDGTFKGKKLETNDYWFKVILTDKEDHQIVTMDHFTLKN
ncbi:T9SS type B sorting domain-containing protein [Gaetbulibacter aestuarii]|uniref:T9SS type B sorting domain-containing protein n=1 Tax=Gaetbulibacter aestuarii TaxID=1502358 RepID=A0ABW7MYY4_9FLAO